MKRAIYSTALLISLIGFGQRVDGQTVRMKFRYQPQATYTRVHFPGNFMMNAAENWGPNSSGTIAAGTPSQADSFETATGMYVKTFIVAFGTFQYKVYRQLSANPTNWSWISDPLNRVTVGGDQNSQLVVDSLVLFQLCAYPYSIESGASGTKFVVKMGLPNLSAGIFQPAGSPSPVVQAFMDGNPIANAGVYRDSASGIFTYRPAAGIPDGDHVFKLIVSAGGQTKSDSVRFEVRGRPVQIQTPSFVTRKNSYIIAGAILKADGTGLDSSLSSVALTVNGSPQSLPAANGVFEGSAALAEGKNILRVSTATGADSITVTRVVNHTPFGSGRVVVTTASELILSAATTTDPDGQTITDFSWFDSPETPLGLNGKTGVQVTIAKPAMAGEYYYGLVSTDPDGNKDTARLTFTLRGDGGVDHPTIAGNPEWAKRARVYFLFPKAASAAGTLAGSLPLLTHIKYMGFNVVWMMPVMKNAYPINNQTGPGYNITDFYNVAPEYGTNQEFKNFVAAAHELGIKVILDVTPNHTSRFHPWSQDAHTNKTRSPYWNWYQHTIISHSDNGLGQSLDADGFNYYSGFSDQLLNVNWNDPDFRNEMISVYKYWIREFGIDGYRFDVYWGPHRRYGEGSMGKPVRDALKHIKPDILLLAEDDGTGGGTETIYADYSSGGVNGGVDAAYDFKLYFNQIRNFGFSSSAVSNLSNEINNGGYFPGPNAMFMRFMESQDEDRIYYTDPNQSTFYDATPALAFSKTKPMATAVFLAPGFPMLWNGQEVGWGYGISGGKLGRNRSVINWDFQGGPYLKEHYRRLAHIRGAFGAFATQTYERIGASSDMALAYVRKQAGENGIVVANFSGAETPITITVNATSLAGTVVNGTNYVLSDLYNATTSNLTFTGGAAQFQVTLPAYGSAVYVLADSAKSLGITSVEEADQAGSRAPDEFRLLQNFPNPFNPSTSVAFELPAASQTTMKVYSLLGEEVATLVDGIRSQGRHVVEWNGRASNGTGAASGVYLVRMMAGGRMFTQKIMLIR